MLRIVKCVKGDFYHACPDHYPDSKAIHPLRGIKMGMVRWKRKERNQILKSKGYTLVELWECQFQKLMERSVTLNSLATEKNLCTHQPIEPRKALHGGRVEVFKCFYSCGEDEDTVIEYYGMFHIHM